MNAMPLNQKTPVQGRTRPRTRDVSLRAFSMVELLVVIGIAIILLSIVVIAVTAGTRAAQRANTQALMNTIQQGLSQFKNDIGYLPPALDHERNLRFRSPDDIDESILGSGPTPRPDAAMENPYQYQRWYSVTSLAEYLIGYGGENEDGHAGLGIRHPGDDGYWGAARDHPCLPLTPGRHLARQFFLNPDFDCAAVSERYRTGQVYGPYMELQDDRLLGSINVDDPNVPLWQNEDAGIYNVLFPGDPNYSDDDPKVIVDYWGQPIRYYRLPYVGTNPAQAYRPRQRRVDEEQFRLPRLSDFFALRPFNVRDAEVVDGLPDLNPGSDIGIAADSTTTHQLNAAQFGLLSPGPNRSVNIRMRVDPLELNEDNIITLGQ